MILCVVTVIHCVVTLIHCVVTVIHCVVTVIHCVVKVKRCVVTVIHCVVSVIHCVVTVIHCVVTVILCVVTVIQCLVTVIHCVVTVISAQPHLLIKSESEDFPFRKCLIFVEINISSVHVKRSAATRRDQKCFYVTTTVFSLYAVNIALFACLISPGSRAPLSLWRSWVRYPRFPPRVPLVGQISSVWQHRMKDLIKQCIMEQLISSSTQRAGHILDWVVVKNDYKTVDNIAVLDHLLSDHCNIIIDLDVKKAIPINRCITSRILKGILERFTQTTLICTTTN